MENIPQKGDLVDPKNTALEQAVATLDAATLLGEHNATNLIEEAERLSVELGEPVGARQLRKLVEAQSQASLETGWQPSGSPEIVAPEKISTLRKVGRKMVGFVLPKTKKNKKTVGVTAGVALAGTIAGLGGGVAVADTQPGVVDTSFPGQQTVGEMAPGALTPDQMLASLSGKQVADTEHVQVRTENKNVYNGMNDRQIADAEKAQLRTDAHEKALQQAAAEKEAADWKIDYLADHEGKEMAGAFGPAYEGAHDKDSLIKDILDRAKKDPAFLAAISAACGAVETSACNNLTMDLTSDLTLRQNFYRNLEALLTGDDITVTFSSLEGVQFYSAGFIGKNADGSPKLVQSGPLMIGGTMATITNGEFEYNARMECGDQPTFIRADAGIEQVTTEVMTAPVEAVTPSVEVTYVPVVDNTTNPENTTPIDKVPVTPTPTPTPTPKPLPEPTPPPTPKPIPPKPTYPPKVPPTPIVPPVTPPTELEQKDPNQNIEVNKDLPDQVGTGGETVESDKLQEEEPKHTPQSETPAETPAKVAPGADEVDRSDEAIKQAETAKDSNTPIYNELLEELKNNDNGTVENGVGNNGRVDG